MLVHAGLSARARDYLFPSSFLGLSVYWSPPHHPTPGCRHSPALSCPPFPLPPSIFLSLFLLLLVPSLHSPALTAAPSPPHPRHPHRPHLASRPMPFPAQDRSPSDAMARRRNALQSRATIELARREQARLLSARTHARTHARARARAHTHTHTHTLAAARRRLGRRL